MEINFIEGRENEDTRRQYVAVCVLKNFKGRQNVEAHLFRGSWAPKELEELRRQDLVAENPALPDELRATASRDAVLECVLETFTREEAEKLREYLADRYSDQIARLDIGPMELPAPLGLTPLGKIPTGSASGFIEFSRARNYPLDFELRAYYELGG